jgi:hypothetical protein
VAMIMIIIKLQVNHCTRIIYIGQSDIATGVSPVGVRTLGELIRARLITPTPNVSSLSPTVGLLFYPEDRSSMFLRNVTKHLVDYTESHTRR